MAAPKQLFAELLNLLPGYDIRMWIGYKGLKYAFARVPSGWRLLVVGEAGLISVPSGGHRGVLRSPFELLLSGIDISLFTLESLKIAQRDRLVATSTDLTTLRQWILCASLAVYVGLGARR